MRKQVVCWFTIFLVGLIIQYSGLRYVTALPAGVNGTKQPTTANIEELIAEIFGPSVNREVTGPSGNETRPIDCECVSFYLCDDNATSTEDEEGLIDIHTRSDPCDVYDKCCRGQHIVRQPDLDHMPPHLDNMCGASKFEAISLVVQDNESAYGEFPWMVAVLQPEATRTRAGKPANVYQCGGSLVHPLVVLTAAYCVSGKNNLTIRAGVWDTGTQNELYPHQDRKVEEVIIHEQFNNDTLGPALLILESPVDISFENVGIICMPEENENMDGRGCVASGWGDKKDNYKPILQRVDLPIVPRGACLEALRQTSLGANFELHPSSICAGGLPGKDSCKAGGGSPLACPSRTDDTVYVQAGVMAPSSSCHSEAPGVHVSVPSHVPWIHDVLQQRDISLV